MMKLRTASGCGPRRSSRPHGEGGGAAIACASAAPLIVLALAVAADHAHVSRFETQVQLAADAASFAAAGGSRATGAGPPTASPTGSPPPFSRTTPRAGLLERRRLRQ